MERNIWTQKGHGKPGCLALGITKPPQIFTSNEPSSTCSRVIFKPVTQPASRSPGCLSSLRFAKLLFVSWGIFKAVGLPFVCRVKPRVRAQLPQIPPGPHPAGSALVEPQVRGCRWLVVLRRGATPASTGHSQGTAPNIHPGAILLPCTGFFMPQPQWGGVAEVSLQGLRWPT